MNHYFPTTGNAFTSLEQERMLRQRPNALLDCMAQAHSGTRISLSHIGNNFQQVATSLLRPDQR